MGDISHTRCSERKSKFYQRPTEVAFSSLPRDFIDLRRCTKSVSCVVCTIQRRRLYRSALGHVCVTSRATVLSLNCPRAGTVLIDVTLWVYLCINLYVCLSVRLSVRLSRNHSGGEFDVLQFSTEFDQGASTPLTSGSKMLPGKSWEEVNWVGYFFLVANCKH